MAEVAEHHGEQKGERDDGVGSCQSQKHSVNFSKAALDKEKGAQSLFFYEKQCEFLPGLTSR